jgi:TDG/mug DNA glycosylase family protein
MVGINPALKSAEVGHYYQGKLGPRIWDRIGRVGLLPSHFDGFADEAFVKEGHGLTDVVKRPTKGEDDLTFEEILAGRELLRARLNEWQPGLVLCVFRAAVEALVHVDLGAGLNRQFGSIPVFRFAGPYSSQRAVDRNLNELRTLLDQLGIDRPYAAE